jgi:DNA-binding MarR family transcriptional regulator
MDSRLEQLLTVCDTLIAMSPQIRLTQLRLLLTVAKHQPLSQTALSEHAGLTLAAVSRAVDVLGSAGRRDGVSGALGLLQVLLDPNDDRLKLVSLTPKGRVLLDHLAGELG